MTKKKILLVEHTVTEFIISRFNLASFLKKQGMEIGAFLPNEDIYIQEEIKKSIPLINYDYNRNVGSLLANIKLIISFFNSTVCSNFNLIHSFKFQPNFYLTISNLFSNKKIVLHITGLGIVYAKKGLKYWILKQVSQAIFFLNFLRADRIIFQNPDDMSDLWLPLFWKTKARLVKGSGVDVVKFDKEIFDKSALRKENDLDSDTVVFTFVSRLIWEKGVRELIEAFEALLNKYSNSKIVLLVIGSPDNKNPNGVTHDFMNKYKNHKNIRFLGKKNNINELLAISDIYVYPSYYREGIPRSVLEALATGLPIITTNMPGCNLTVNEHNGIMIPPKNSIKLTAAMDTLINCQDKWKSMGYHSRQLAINTFMDEKIFEQILKIYQEIL